MNAVVRISGQVCISSKNQFLGRTDSLQLKIRPGALYTDGWIFPINLFIQSKPMGAEIFNIAILSSTLIMVGLGAGFLLLKVQGSK
jgi:cytochrome b6-f complex subunit 7